MPMDLNSLKKLEKKLQPQKIPKKSINGSRSPQPTLGKIGRLNVNTSCFENSQKLCKVLFFYFFSRHKLVKTIESFLSSILWHVKSFTKECFNCAQATIGCWQLRWADICAWRPQNWNRLRKKQSLGVFISNNINKKLRQPYWNPTNGWNYSSCSFCSKTNLSEFLGAK